MSIRCILVLIPVALLAMCSQLLPMMLVLRQAALNLSGMHHEEHCLDDARLLGAGGSFFMALIVCMGLKPLSSTERTKNFLQDLPVQLRHQAVHTFLRRSWRNLGTDSDAADTPSGIIPQCSRSK